MTDLDGQFSSSRQISRGEFLRRVGAITALATAPSLLTACGGAASPSGSLRIGYSTSIDSMNPFASQTGQWQCLPVAPRLVEQELPTSPITPSLATSWTVDGDEYTFHLNPKGKWLDGSPITADDVAFTLQLILKYPGPAALLVRYATGASAVRVIDPHTVVISYSSNSDIALTGLTLLPILPKYVWEAYAVGDGSKLATAQLNTTGLQGGSFKVARYVQNEIALLEPHAGYYGPTPKLKEIGFQYFATDSGLVEGLQRNEVNALQTTIGIPAGLLRLTKPEFDVSYTHGLIFPYVAFNSNPKKPHHRELLDPRVRLAFDLAIDKARIVSDIYFGHADPGSALIPAGLTKWTDSTLAPESYDPAKANQILDGLGYRRNGSGLRRADGHAMSYTMYIVTDLGSYEELSQILVEGWAQVGIQIKVTPLDSAAMFEATTGPNGKYLTNDMHVWFNGVVYDPNNLLASLTTAQLAGFNDPGFSNPQYDQLFKQQETATRDTARRALIYQMQNLVYELKPLIPLATPDAWRASVAGLQHLPLTPIEDTVPTAPNGWATQAQLT